MDSKEAKNLMEAYSSVYSPEEQIDEITADLGLRASKAADKKRAELARTGDKEGAAAKAAQASRLYAKQAKIRLNREEVDIFDVVLEFLQAEGYAETLEEAEWMMANVIDEEAISIILGEEQLDEISDRLAKAARNTRDRRYNASFGDGGPSANYYKNDAKRNMLNKTLASRAARTGSKIKPVEEDFELWVNEAQHARENPEKYEREQSKKSAPVRGERTPMPPRGDKRREDFEKWYAANVR